jgi:hypothetical protein
MNQSAPSNNIKPLNNNIVSLPIKQEVTTNAGGCATKTNTAPSPALKYYSKYPSALNRNLYAANEHTKNICQYISADCAIKNHKAATDIILNMMLYGSCYYSRRTETVPPERYSSSRNSSRALKSCVDALVENGYLSNKPGKKDFATGEGRQSVFTVTDKFLKAYDQRRVVINERTPETIRLNEKRGDTKIPIDYDDTPQIEEWRFNVETVNRFNRAADWRLFGTKVTVESYRVFNFDADHAEFTRGGRFYHPALNISKAYRHGITCNGERTMIADYKALHPVLAYSHMGLCYSEIYPENPDPYLINTETSSIEREVNKLLVLCGFNASSRDSAVEAVRGKIKRRVAEGKLGAEALMIDLYPAYDKFTAYHAPIQEQFNRGNGTLFHYHDSQLLNEIMLRCVERGIAPFGIHDAVLAAQSDIITVKAIMERAYYDMYGHSAIVEIDENLPQQEKKGERGEKERGEKERILFNRRQVSQLHRDSFSNITETGSPILPRQVNDRRYLSPVVPATQRGAA